MTNPHQPWSGGNDPWQTGPSVPPPGFPLFSPYPGAGARLGAYIIDYIVVGLVSALIGLAFLWDDISRWMDRLADWDPDTTADAPELDMGGFYLVGLLTLLLWFLYRTVMETTRGQTLGKMALKMKVVDIDGQLPTAGASFTRNSWYLILTVVGMVPLLGWFASVGIYIALGVTISKDTYRQSFTDRWAKTYVVSTR